METIKIKNTVIERTAALAPMASVSDISFRLLNKRFGAAYVVGEMASSKGLCYSDRKTAELLRVTESERPMGVQLFGDDPDFMTRAAVIAAGFSPDIIDINMGCPVPKVAGNGSGSALMKNPELAAKIVSAVANAVDIPVAVKIRKGWDLNSVNAVAFAKLMEQSGAAAITVHGRTRSQYYSGEADIDIIKQVKNAVAVPVIGNGDVCDVKSCVNMYEKTGCDLVMIGRAAYGNPWIFKEISHYFKTGEIPPRPGVRERMDVMLEHISMICENEGEKSGMLRARKHAMWYVKGLNGAADLRRECSALSEYSDAVLLAKTVLELNPE